jgi:hypothetical protein
MGFGTRVIYTPAGQCPVKLKGIDYNDVLEWSNLIMESGREKRLNYLPSAILFFSQQFYGVHTKEYNVIKEHIANIFNSNPSIDVEKLERKEIKEEEVNVVEDEVEKNIIKYKKKKKNK